MERLAPLAGEFRRLRGGAVSLVRPAQPAAVPAAVASSWPARWKRHAEPARPFRLRRSDADRQLMREACRPQAGEMYLLGDVRHMRALLGWHLVVLSEPTLYDGEQRGESRIAALELRFQIRTALRWAARSSARSPFGGRAEMAGRKLAL